MQNKPTYPFTKPIPPPHTHTHYTNYTHYTHSQVFVLVVVFFFPDANQWNTFQDIHSFWWTVPVSHCYAGHIATVSS